MVCATKVLGGRRTSAPLPPSHHGRIATEKPPGRPRPKRDGPCDKVFQGLLGAARNTLKVLVTPSAGPSHCSRDQAEIALSSWGSPALQVPSQLPASG